MTRNRDFDDVRPSAIIVVVLYYVTKRNALNFQKIR